MQKADENAIWDAYNLLMAGPDIERIRKMLARYELFKKTLHIPGDIVECGVFKGANLLFFLKLLHIHAHGSAKRVIGFDMFSSFPVEDRSEAAEVGKYLDVSNFSGITPEEIFDKITACGIAKEKCELVAGDITETAPNYLESHPGLRISLLNLDLDLDKPTYASLQAFWPRIVHGGVVIFDEYAIPNWTESAGVDRFFADHSVTIRTLKWARTPTAYVIKR
jgi:hypothetical protein